MAWEGPGEAVGRLRGQFGGSGRQLQHRGGSVVFRSAANLSPGQEVAPPILPQSVPG